MKNKNLINTAEIVFDAISENESFARVVAASFVTPLDPTIEEIADIKTAVSEAVTNCIVHGYEGKPGKISMKMGISDRIFSLEIHDDGVGIPDIHRAMEPLFTTKPELERSGMGFSFMEAFMDDLKVVSEKGKGTTVYMAKKIGEED
ncbi:MAG: anti-sigma F factor [Lachnospira sp.]